MGFALRRNMFLTKYPTSRKAWKEHDPLVYDMLKDLKLDRETLVGFYNGAYLRINDGGHRYARWEARVPNLLGEHAARRFWASVSSHTSAPGSNQYRLATEHGEILFGKGVAAGARNLETVFTFIQYERMGICSLCHVLDMYIHICVLYNIGPYGTSRFTQYNPLLIDTGPRDCAPGGSCTTEASMRRS